MFITGFPGSGNVMRKNLAVCGSDWFALANPLNGDCIFIPCVPAIWLRDDPAEADPIEKRMASSVVENTGPWRRHVAAQSPMLLNA